MSDTWEQLQMAAVDDLELLETDEHTRDTAADARWIALGQPEMVIPT